MKINEIKNKANGKVQDIDILSGRWGQSWKPSVWICAWWCRGCYSDSSQHNILPAVQGEQEDSLTCHLVATWRIIATLGPGESNIFRNVKKNCRHTFSRTKKDAANSWAAKAFMSDVAKQKGWWEQCPSQQTLVSPLTLLFLPTSLTTCPDELGSFLLLRFVWYFDWYELMVLLESGQE